MGRSLLAATVFVLTLLLAAAHAQTSEEGARLTPVERQLALAVAKVCVNEAGFHSPADCALIWQTAENRADTTMGRLRWLRAHSSCVLDSTQEEADGRRGNCRWTRNLSRSERRPERYPTGWTWNPDHWRRVLWLSERLVSGEETRRPCPSAPFTWGGPMDHDNARENGLVPLGCDGTRNDGFAVVR